MKSSLKPAGSPSPSLPSPASPLAPPSSKTQPTFKTKQEALDFIASQFGLPLSSELTALPQAVFPPFPKLHELVEAERAPSSSRPKGLFEELLGSRPEAMYLDADAHPEKYEDGALELLRELVATPRELSAAERELLDRSVLAFLERPRPKTPSHAPVREKMSAATFEDDGGADGGDFGLDDGSDVPAPAQGDDPPPFWWL